MSIISNSIQSYTKSNSTGGFSLIEVLVAMVVLSIGLLGLAGLQASGLKNNHGAYLRTQATVMAEDMADRIRANMEGMRNGEYDDIDTTSVYDDPGCSNSATGCSPAQMAQFDAHAWGNTMANILPGGVGTVSGAGGGSMFTVTVMWDDDRTGVTGTDCSGDSAVDLKCFVMRTEP